MKLLFSVVFCVLFGTSFGDNSEATGGHCINSIHDACLSNSPAVGLDEMKKNATICTSTFGGFPQLSDRIQSLVAKKIQASMQYLLIANHFSEWEIDRKGFQGVFDKMSDDTFEEAITLIKHMTLRGGRLSNFKVPMPENESYQLGELEAMSKALDIEKQLASKSLNIVHAATHGDVKTNQHTDGEFAHFLANQVSSNNAVRIKTLANHVNTLSQAISHALAKNRDASFVLHLYDTQFL